MCIVCNHEYITRHKLCVLYAIMSTQWDINCVYCMQSWVYNGIYIVCTVCMQIWFAYTKGCWNRRPWKRSSSVQMDREPSQMYPLHVFHKKNYPNFHFYPGDNHFKIKQITSHVYKIIVIDYIHNLFCFDSPRTF